MPLGVDAGLFGGDASSAASEVDLGEPLFSAEPDDQEALEPEAAPLDGAAPQPQPEPAPPPAQPESGHVPLAAVLDEREKRQAAERRAQALERQIAERTATQEAPSIYDDPEGYQRDVDARLAASQYQIREEMSGRFAVQLHGQEALDAAKAWGHEAAKGDPTFGTRFMNQADPFAWLIAEHKRDTISRDPEAFARNWAAQNGYQLAGSPPPAGAPQAQPQAQPQAPSAAPAAPLAPPPPPRSIVSAPSGGGGHVEVPMPANVMEAVKFNLG